MALDAKAELRDAVEKIIDLRPPARKRCLATETSTLLDTTGVMV